MWSGEDELGRRYEKDDCVTMLDEQSDCRAAHRTTRACGKIARIHAVRDVTRAGECERLLTLKCTRRFEPRALTALVVSVGSRLYFTIRERGARR